MTKTWIVIAALAVTAFFAGMFGAQVVLQEDTGSYHVSTQIEEDDPRWNCETMGNLECQPVDYVAPWTV